MPRAFAVCWRLSTGGSVAVHDAPDFVRRSTPLKAAPRRTQPLSPDPRDPAAERVGGGPAGTILDKVHEAKAEDPGLMTEDEREAIIRDLSISTRKAADMLGCSKAAVGKWRMKRGLSRKDTAETVSEHAPKLSTLPPGRPENEERRKVEEATGASRATVYRDIAKVNAPPRAESSPL